MAIAAHKYPQGGHSTAAVTSCRPHEDSRTRSRAMYRACDQHGRLAVSAALKADLLPMEAPAGDHLAPAQRNTVPEVFTFDPLPAPTVSAGGHRRATLARRKRPRRVLYPPVVRKYLPAEETNPARRLLFLLLTIVCFQVYSATETPEDDLAFPVEDALDPFSSQAASALLPEPPATEDVANASVATEPQEETVPAASGEPMGVSVDITWHAMSPVLY